MVRHPVFPLLCCCLTLCAIARPAVADPYIPLDPWIPLEMESPAEPETPPEEPGSRTAAAVAPGPDEIVDRAAQGDLMARQACQWWVLQAGYEGGQRWLASAGGGPAGSIQQAAEAGACLVWPLTDDGRPWPMTTGAMPEYDAPAGQVFVETSAAAPGLAVACRTGAAGEGAPWWSWRTTARDYGYGGGEGYRTGGGGGYGSGSGSANPVVPPYYLEGLAVAMRNGAWQEDKDFLTGGLDDLLRGQRIALVQESMEAMRRRGMSIPVYYLPLAKQVVLDVREPGAVSQYVVVPFSKSALPAEYPTTADRAWGSGPSLQSFGGGLEGILGGLLGDDVAALLGAQPMLYWGDLLEMELPTIRLWDVPQIPGAAPDGGSDGGYGGWP